MRIRGLGRLKTTLARIRGQLTPGPIVLLYHRVAELSAGSRICWPSRRNISRSIADPAATFPGGSLSELTESLAHGSRLGTGRRADL